MIYLIIGRSGVGKDYLVNLLNERGLSAVKSYATRPKRSEDEDTHIFIKPEEVNDYPDKVAETEINGYTYFATKTQVEEADIYVIDPNGAKELINNMPDTSFHIVYIKADDTERRIKAVSRVENDKKITESEVFNERCKSENAQFSEFENYIEAKRQKESTEYGADRQNAAVFHIFTNNYNEDEINEFADELVKIKKIHDNVITCLNAGVEIGVFDIKNNDPTQIKIAYKDEKGGYEKRATPIDVVADDIVTNDEGIIKLMLNIMAKKTIELH